MGARAALAAGTALSAVVTGAWSYTASLTIGPAAPVHLGRTLSADYAALAAAPTGNGVALFAVTAVIYAACFLVSGLRRIRRERAASRELERACADAEAAEHAAGWR
jgi:hypothetical protein